MLIEIEAELIYNAHLQFALQLLSVYYWNWAFLNKNISINNNKHQKVHHRAAGSYCKPPPGQFKRTLENLIKILTSPDIRIYKLPSKETFPLLGLLFLRGLGRRLWWVFLLSIRPHGAAADGQKIPELLVFNLHQHK